MKKENCTFLIVLSIFFASCSNADNSSEKNRSHTQAKDTSAVVSKKEKFADIQFASKKDTICGMPLSAGIEDTLILDGKVYGFCAPGCKADFVTQLIKQHKR